MPAPELEGLLALQDLDTKIDQERHSRANLPERKELAQLEAEIAKASAERAEAAAALEEVASRQAAAERDLSATEQREEQVNAVLYGGAVTATRELQAMAADVESLKRRASELEDRVLAAMEEREPLDRRLAELDSKLAALRGRQQDAEARLATAEAQSSAEIDKLLAGRPALLSAVPAKLLADYERLRERLGGVAVSRLVGGRCDGCHLSLPAVELDRIRHQPSGPLEHCEQCGRILVVLGD
jgi:predicted  nucleic acid-binding Zn-ribbon protein